jgi:ATP/maltotriose-dependent transcriptional regulator MalT
MQRRIDAAEKAISQRSEELKQSGNESIEEQQAMADALRALRLLARAECRPQLSSLGSLSHNGTKP